MRVSIICFIFLSAAFSCLSQSNKRLDSLLQRLQSAPKDTHKVLLLANIISEYQILNVEMTRPYLKQALDLSQELGYTKGITKTYSQYAYLYSYQSKFDSSIYINREMLNLAMKEKDSFRIGAAFFNMGSSFRFKQELDSALLYLLAAAKLLEGKGYTNIEGTLYDGLQSLYMSMGQYDQAVSYGERAVQMARKTQNMEDLTTALNNLGLIFVEMDRVNDAKRVYIEGLAVASKIGYTQLQAMLLNNMGDLLIQEGKFEEAATNVFKAIEILKNHNDESSRCASLLILGYYHLHKKDFAKSKQIAMEVLDVAMKVGLPENEEYALELLSSIAFAQMDIASGLEYRKRLQKKREKIFNESLKQREASWRVRYDTEQKENKILLQQQTLNQQKIWNYFLIGGIVAVLGVSLLSYRNYRQRQKIQQQRINELETEKQLAATEAVLKGEEQERTRLAKDLHDGLGGMLSGIKYSLHTMKGNLIMTPENAQAFERSMDMLDSSIQEMRRVAHNMMPEALVKFGLHTALKDFCNDINQSGALKVNYQSIGLEDEKLEQTTAVTIYRIVQELLNNVIKHSNATEAIVQVSKTGNVLSLTVEDNGKGFDTNSLIKPSGIGWSNIRNRVDFLKGNIDLHSAPGKGTSVHIEIGN